MLNLFLELWISVDLIYIQCENLIAQLTSKTRQNSNSFISSLTKDTEFQIQGFEMANFPHDVKTQSGLTGIYNEKVTNVERMARPMGSSGGQCKCPICAKFIVTTDHGNQYLIHKGAGYGNSSQTVVTDAKHMSNQWQSMGSRDVGGNQNVGSYVGTGGANYNLLSDNCIHGAGRMFKK
ncbi:uncharacterized protein LOC134719300 [Mytilus trossulus]|uniref:uncharacterized protein LOC134719300 n=1 Tax=Mytilus trossulus TaxID=6551 RepID=UPI0030071E90